MWVIDFNGLFLDFSALCKCRLLALQKPFKRTGHCANLENFTILEKANNEYDLLIFESLLILRDRPSLNAQNSSIPLVLF